MDFTCAHILTFDTRRYSTEWGVQNILPLVGGNKRLIFTIPLSPTHRVSKQWHANTSST